MLRAQRRQVAVDTIAGWIVGGRYGPGDTLPIEPAMGEELAVRRTVVREALKTLTAKGMVVTGPRLGTPVCARSAWNHFDPEVVHWRLEAGVDEAFVRDLLELRRAIEPAAARLVAGAPQAARRGHRAQAGRGRVGDVRADRNGTKGHRAADRPRPFQDDGRARMNLLPGAFAQTEARFFRYLEQLMVFLLSAMVQMRRLRMAFGNVAERELALPFFLLAGAFIAPVIPASTDLVVLGRA